MPTPFRWKNCFADVLTHRNGEMAQSYIRDIVAPSVSALQHQIQHMRDQHDDPVAVFGIGPAESLLRATLLGYCLSIQAVWEQQLREWLRGCAHALGKESALSRQIDTSTWTELDVIFKELRGVSLTDFNEYDELNRLQLLANVCRHGTGTSLRRLAVKHPELWSKDPQSELVPPPPGAHSEQVRTVANLNVSLELLNSLAAAIDSFWRETEYIYNESIERKAESLEARLVEERRKRAGRGRPWDPPS